MRRSSADMRRGSAASVQDNYGFFGLDYCLGLISGFRMNDIFEDYY